MLLTLWQWRKDAQKYILRPAGDLPFAGSPSFSAEWIARENLEAGDPLARPIADGYHLYVAKCLERFPYEIEAIQRVDSFFSQYTGLYFIADSKLIARLSAYGLPIIIPPI
jgi:hypothetical protein